MDRGKVTELIIGILRFKSDPLFNSQLSSDEHGFSHCRNSVDRIFSTLENLNAMVEHLPLSLHMPILISLTEIQDKLIIITNFKRENESYSSQEICNTLNIHATELSSKIEAWKEIITHVNDSSKKNALDGITQKINQYKELVIALSVIVVVWSYFASKDDLNKNIERLTCLLQTNVQLINVQNRLDDKNIKLSNLNRKLEYANNTNVTDEITRLERRIRDIETEIGQLDRNKSGVQEKLNTLALTIDRDWKECTKN